MSKLLRIAGWISIGVAIFCLVYTLILFSLPSYGAGYLGLQLGRIIGYAAICGGMPLLIARKDWSKRHPLPGILLLVWLFLGTCWFIWNMTDWLLGY